MRDREFVLVARRVSAKHRRSRRTVQGHPQVETGARLLGGEGSRGVGCEVIRTRDREIVAFKGRIAKVAGGAVVEYFVR